MVNFREVSPEDFPEIKNRSRIAYPIITEFMNSELDAAMVNREKVGKSTASIYASISFYVKNNDVPVKILSRNGETYIVRLEGEWITKEKKHEAFMKFLQENEK